MQAGGMDKGVWIVLLKVMATITSSPPPSPPQSPLLDQVG
jgi:hypothetical protein